MSLTGAPVNYRSFLGVALEATAGTPVKSLYELDFVSETIKGVSTPIRRKSINRKRSVKGAVMGAYSAEGDINLEVTPDKVSTLFYAALTGITNSGTAAPYTHSFKPGTTLLPLTLQIQRANQIFIYPAQYVSKIVLKGIIDAIMEAQIGLKGAALEKIYDTEQSDAGITASALDPFVFYQGTVSLHGAATTDTNNWNVEIDTGLQLHKGLGAGRAANRAHPGDAVCKGSFDIVFDTIEEHRRFLGASSSSYPISPGNTLQTLDAQLLYTAGQYSLLVEMTKLYYEASGPNINGREGIVIQPLQFSSLYDGSPDADVTLTLINNETASAITTAGTAIP